MEIFTVEEVAKMFKVHPESLRRLIRDGRLKAAKVGRDFRISQKQLDDFWRRSTGEPLFDQTDEPSEASWRTRETRTVRPRPEERNINTHGGKINLILDLLQENMSYSQIANELNRRGVLMMSGRLNWSKSTVYSLVKAYIPARAGQLTLW